MRYYRILRRSPRRKEQTHRAETLDAGSIEWDGRRAAKQNAGKWPASTATAKTKLQADKLEMEFGAGRRRFCFSRYSTHLRCR